MGISWVYYSIFIVYGLPMALIVDESMFMQHIIVYYDILWVYYNVKVLHALQKSKLLGIVVCFRLACLSNAVCGDVVTLHRGFCTGFMVGLGSSVC